MSDLGYLGEQRVRIALQGHAPIAAATKAVHDTLKALREGTPPKALTGLASAELTAKVTREAEVNARVATFLKAPR
jgi:carboxyvinyl-carboxyphosphonate phosphorylmutase